MKRRFFAPEVIQTSQMDCGAAALTALLVGSGIPVSYGRLREACQTDVDGTSIDTLEDVARRLGLDAVQTMLPVEYLTTTSIDPFPALLVTRDPVGAPHFVVAWRSVGRRIQLMDPGRGRRWVSAATLRESLFVHRMPVSAAMWRRWCESGEAQRAFAARLAQLGARTEGERLLEAARATPTWHGFGALDAVLRMAESLAATGAVARGREAAGLLASLFERAVHDARASSLPTLQEHVAPAVPWAYWSAAPGATTSNREEQIMLSGTVLVRVFGLRAPSASHDALPRELEAALREPSARPLRQLAHMLKEDGLFAPAALALTTVAAAIGGAMEALLLRSVIDVGRHLGVIEQRLAGLGFLAALVGILLALDVSVAHGALRMGRGLETRLRIAFLSKLPRLHDRYFQSRPVSDMAHRCHEMHPVREVPVLGTRLFRSVLDLLVVASGLAWIDPSSWPLVVGAVLASTLGPWLAQRTMAERDLRVRSFDGALSRFYLDALLGAVPVRAHGAQPSLSREHTKTSLEWARAAGDRLRASVIVDAAQQIAGSAIAVLLVFAYLAHSAEPAAALLFLYWALALPTLGQEIARAALLYPAMRNRLLRVSEPLNALEDEDANHAEPGSTITQAKPPDQQAYVIFRDVSMCAAGHTILENIDLRIEKGSHVAIVGPSGAGKSSLVGLLLGWHRPASGSILVEAQPLRSAHLQRVRAETAWVDPSVQLWNRSLVGNLQYGVAANGKQDMGRMLEDAHLLELVERLPDGMQTQLGEGGALVAGGEGQRVRLGRVLMRSPKLVILDEAFRGLDRESRHALLSRTRERWKDATLVCVTHDVSETLGFDRVLVLANGRIVEDGAPAELSAQQGSRYQAMLRAEQELRNTSWSARFWRRWTVQDGRVSEETTSCIPDEGAA